jgi:hypothetical protein
MQTKIPCQNIGKGLNIWRFSGFILATPGIGA